MKWDLFISHASEDKEDIVRPLCYELFKQNIWRIWYDEKNIQPGDSIVGRINEGLRDTRHGLVMLTSNFFKKRWTLEELESLQSMGKRLLPIWYGVTANEVMSFSPLIGRIKAIDYSIGTANVARQVANFLNKDRTSRVHQDKKVTGENEAFWALVRIYFWWALGDLDPAQARRLDSAVAPGTNNGRTWQQSVENQLGIGVEFVQYVRQ